MDRRGYPQDSVDGGGFADIFQASYQGKPVALKRMRFFGKDPQSINLSRVCFPKELCSTPTSDPFLVVFPGGHRLAAAQPSECCGFHWDRFGVIRTTLHSYAVDATRNDTARFVVARVHTHGYAGT